jgi:hypothetical protein
MSNNGLEFYEITLLLHIAPPRHDLVHIVVDNIQAHVNVIEKL